MTNHFRPTLTTEKTGSQLQTGVKQTVTGLWPKTARAVNSVPGRIYIGLKWLASLPGKIHPKISNRRRIFKRSIKLITKKPRQIGKIISKKRPKLSLSKVAHLFNRHFSSSIHPEINCSDQSSPVSKIHAVARLVDFNPGTTGTSRTSLFESLPYDDEDLVPLIDENDTDQDEVDQLSYQEKVSAHNQAVHLAHASCLEKPGVSPSLTVTNKDRFFRNVWMHISEVQLDILTAKLKNRRGLVQKFILDTQVAFLRYGPSTASTLAKLDQLEESTLDFTRGLLKHNDQSRTHQGLQSITQSLEEDFKGLRLFIEHTTRHDFRSSHQYLQQIHVYERLVENLISLPPYRKEKEKYLEKATALINHKKENALALYLPEEPALKRNERQVNDPPVESVSDNMDDFLELDCALRKLFSNTKHFDQELMKVLSENAQPFETQFNVYLDGTWKEISTSYIPAAAMRLHSSTELSVDQPGPRCPFELDYKGKMAPSMQRDTKHAVNMMGYTMKIDGQPVTRQIRVGCPHAYAEKDESTRERVTHDRIKEIFTALLVQNHQQELQEAISNPWHTPINLEAVYMNLLSPDSIRNNRLMTAIGQDDEKKWVKKLHEAFKTLSGQEMELTVYLDCGQDVTVKIIPDVRMFVIPCNQLALKQPAHSSFFKKALNYLMRTAGNTWKTVNTVNNESISWLMGPDGLVSRKIGTLPEDRQRIVIALNNQLWDLLNSKRGFEAIAHDFDPYIFAELLFQILEALNIDIFSGCKSNKDRTSIVQAVLQSLLTTDMHLHQSQASNPLYNIIVELFMVYGGHTEVQKRNTGLVGFRLDETPVRDMNRISTELMRRNPGREKRKQRAIFSDSEMFTPIEL